jgi:hypothetical protein
METKSRSGRDGPEVRLRICSPSTMVKAGPADVLDQRVFQHCEQARLSPDEASAFEGEHHLVDGERRQ